MTIVPKLRDQMMADYDRHLDWITGYYPFLFKTESSIEESLLVAIAHVAATGGQIELSNVRLEQLMPRDFGRSAVVLLQEQYGPWRVDFAVIVRDTSGYRNLGRTIIVECDGHDWHERTPDQASRDKSRDRYFAENGMAVMRFTGREIWADAIACARQIDAAVINIATDWQIEIGRVASSIESRGGDQ